MPRKLGIWYPKAALDVQDVIDPFSLFTFDKIFEFPESEGNFNPTANYSFPSVQDGDPVVKTFDNFTIPAGVTVTTTNRCKGLYINILGNLTINGTLSMTARGAKAAGRYVITDHKRMNIYFLEQNENLNNIKAAFEKNQIIYPTGGLGKIKGANVGTNGACGSGGGSYAGRAKGGNGTSFSGGAGAGGELQLNNKPTYTTYSGQFLTASGSTSVGQYTAHGQEIAAQGGAGCYKTSGCYSGSGAGNPGGISGNANSKGKSGTGGLIILVVNGDILGNGSIVSCGSDGGNAANNATDVITFVAGGAGSGGGAIHIFHRKTIASTIQYDVSGGKQGLSATWQNATTMTSYQSYAGGKGTVNIVKI